MMTKQQIMDMTRRQSNEFMQKLDDKATWQQYNNTRKQCARGDDTSNIELFVIGGIHWHWLKWICYHNNQKSLKRRSHHAGASF